MSSLVRDRLQSDHVKDSLPGQRPCDVAENHKSSNDILEIMQNICRDIKFQLIMDPRNNIIKLVFDKAKLYSPELATPSRIVAAICHFYLVKLLHSTDEKNAHDGCNYFNGTSQEEILPVKLEDFLVGCGALVVFPLSWTTQVQFANNTIH